MRVVIAEDLVLLRDGLIRLPILILSQYVEQLYARELLADATGAVGYLLKDRVADIAQFMDAVHHISHIFDKLGLPPSSDDHRRVLAVLAFLDTADTRVGG